MLLRVCATNQHCLGRRDVISASHLGASRVFLMAWLEEQLIKKNEINTVLLLVYYILVLNATTYGGRT